MTTNDKLRSVVAAYPAAKTERERAQLEQNIWNFCPHEERRRLSNGNARHSWLVVQLGALPSSDTGYRQRLLSAGTDADPLWEQINSGDMLLVTATNLLLEARRLAAKTHKPVSDALAGVLADQEKLPLYFTPKGKPFRKRTMSQNAARRIVEEGHTVRAPRAPSKTPVDPAPSQDASLKSAREILMRAFAPMLHRLDPLEAEQHMRTFDIEMRQVFEICGRKLRRLADRQKNGAVALSTRKLRDSCQALAMDPPPQGKLPNLAKAKSQMRKLVNIYHPDKSGTEATAPQLQAVVDAYAFIEGLTEQAESQ